MTCVWSEDMKQTGNKPLLLMDVQPPLQKKVYVAPKLLSLAERDPLGKDFYNPTEATTLHETVGPS